MNFKQKFGHMFIGCLFTLTGYFFASLGGSPSPQDTAHAQQNEEVIEKLVCKEIVIVDKHGTMAAKITDSLTDGNIQIYNKDRKKVVELGTNIMESGYIYSKNKI